MVGVTWRFALIDLDRQFPIKRDVKKKFCSTGSEISFLEIQPIVASLLWRSLAECTRSLPLQGVAQLRYCALIRFITRVTSFVRVR